MSSTLQNLFVEIFTFATLGIFVVLLSMIVMGLCYLWINIGICIQATKLDKIISSVSYVNKVEWQTEIIDKSRNIDDIKDKHKDHRGDDAAWR